MTKDMKIHIHVANCHSQIWISTNFLTLRARVYLAGVPLAGKDVALAVLVEPQLLNG